MASLRHLWFRILHAFRPERGEADLSREITAHLSILEDQLKEQGLSAAAAYTEARRRIGGVAVTKANQRDARSSPSLNRLRMDLRDALRSIARHPRATLAAVVILASSGTINALVLGVADGVLLRPLPYRQPDELVVMMMRHERSGQRSTMISGPIVGLFRDARAEFSEAGLINSLAPVRRDLPSGLTRPLSVNGVTSSYLQILGIPPVRGRLLGSADAHGRTALISHDVWVTRFGAHPAVVGQTIAAGGRTFEVVGVLPPGVYFPTLGGEKPDILTLTDFPNADPTAREGALHPILRLSKGTSLERAQAQVTALAAQMVPANPEGRSLPELVPIDDVLFPTARPVMRLLLAGAAILVILACVNLGSLVLIRGRRRSHEIGVKLALGARSAQLVRPVLFEIALLAVTGGAIAVVVAQLLFESVLQQIPGLVYGNAPVGVDLRVALLTIGCALAGAILFAFVPTWRATRRDAQVLMRGAPSRTSTSDWSVGRPLVAIQVALSVLLVFGALITAKAFVQVLSVPLGFDPDRVAMFTPPVPTGADRVVFATSLLDRLRQHPAVEAAGAAGHVPFDGATADDGGMRAGEKEMRVGISYILPGLPEALGMTLVRGRTLLPDDVRTDVDAAVVSESAARALFGNADPIGASFQSSSGRKLRVVGVVGDVRDGLAQEKPPAAYAIPTAGRRPLRIVVRLRSRSTEVINDLAAQLGFQQPRSEIVSPWWSDRISAVAEYRNPRFQTIVLVALGSAALILTLCGIVAVVGYLVASRTHELGIRLIVGAQPAQLVRFVVRQSSGPVVVGLALGLGATYWIGKLAEAQLFKVSGSDPIALAVTATLVLASATIAAYVPARRAGKIDAVGALRAE